MYEYMGSELAPDFWPCPYTRTYSFFTQLVKLGTRCLNLRLEPEQSDNCQNISLSCNKLQALFYMK